MSHNSHKYIFSASSTLTIETFVDRDTSSSDRSRNTSSEDNDVTSHPWFFEVDRKTAEKMVAEGAYYSDIRKNSFFLLLKQEYSIKVKQI